MITAKELVKRYCSMFDLNYVEGDDVDEEGWPCAVCVGFASGTELAAIYLNMANGIRVMSRVDVDSGMEVWRDVSEQELLASIVMCNRLHNRETQEELPMKQEKKAQHNYYNENPIVSDNKFIGDVENPELVTTLVHRFVRDNKFEKLIDALDDVTPAEWRAQVNKAAEKLESDLIEVLENAENELHGGQFTASIDRTKCGGVH